MKWCVTFPEETVLVVRPSLAAICMDSKPAGKLLGALLYRYSIRKEHQTEAENINEAKAAQGKQPDQDTTFRIYRTQAQLVEDMCGEITETTLHDVAAPMLQLLGYLDIEEMPGRNCYDLHLEPITAALALYNPNGREQPKLAAFFPGQLQLEKFLIQLEDFPIAPNELEKFLIDRKNLLLLLEKVLIANRNFSHCKRGRKPRSGAASEGKSEEPQIGIKIGTKTRKKDTGRPGKKEPPDRALSPSSSTQDDPVVPSKNEKPEPPSKKVELTPEQKARARLLKAKIEDRCGKLPTSGPNIGENKAIAVLVQHYSDEDIADELHYLEHCHFKWSKPDFKFKIRGNVLLDEMEPTLKLFADSPHLRTATEPPSMARARPAEPPQHLGPAYQRIVTPPPLPPIIAAPPPAGT